MLNSVGQKLQQARINKQLSVEEAARVTRIRPDKLIDLEEDNYANFPSMSYAKGFLLLYARFLGVDVHDFTDNIHTPNPVSTDDYEYLNAGATAPPPQPSRRPYHFSPRRERTILPVIVFGFLIGAIVLAIYLFVTFQRLGPLDDLAEKKDISSPAASPAISTLPAAPVTPVAPVVPAPAPVAPVLRSTAPALVAAPPSAAPAVPAYTPPVTAAVQPTPTPLPAATFDPGREVRRAEPVFPTPPGHAAASPVSPPAAASGPVLSAIAPVSPPEPLKQVSIRPIRKTWVTIRRDVADSAPFFQDWLYPGDAPLKLTGHKFWIQVDDPAGIEVTQDGQTLTAGGNEIQIE